MQVLYSIIQELIDRERSNIGRRGSADKMWAEIVTASVVVGLVGLIFRFQAGRIKAVEDKLKCKVDNKVCNIHYDELKESLVKDSDRFEKLIVEQTKVGKTLARLDERIQLLLDNAHG